MKRLIAAAVMAILVTSIAAAVSFPVTGSSNLSSYRDTPSSSGLVGHGAWTSTGSDGGIQISWNISQYASGNWNYTYTFSKVGGGQLCNDVCHMLLEVSSSITASNYNQIIYNSNSSITAPQTYTSSYSNPGLPTSIYAIQLSNEPNDTFSFISTHAPMWGSFYAVDGSCSTYVWNSGIGGYPSSGSGPFTGWIPVPDTTATSGGPTIPEPATLALLGLGFLGAFARRRIARA